MAFSFPTSPTVGQRYSVSGGPTYTWNGTAWVVLTPGQQFNKQSYTATQDQTTFTVTSGYVVNEIDVYRNGVKLISTDDYTATNGSTFILNLPANVGDSIEVVSYAQVLYVDVINEIRNFPFYTSEGNPSFINLVNEIYLPFYTSSGSSSDIPLTTSY